MHVIITTLSFAIHRCHEPVYIPTNMIQSAIHYILSYILCVIILYGFVLINLPLMDLKQNKWWDHMWNTSFQYLAWGTQPMVQYVTKYVESIQIQPHTNNIHFSHWRVHCTTGLAHKLAYTAIITMSTCQTCHISKSIPFDTDSQMVRIDNRCSACITHVCEDMPGELNLCHRSIKGFGGAKVWDVWHGTIKWCIEDDTGVRHTLIIPNSYYVPQAKVCLLSPQHSTVGSSC